MKIEDLNDLKEVAELLYYEMNPETKMCVPNTAYIMTEKWANEWAFSGSHLSLYDWIKANKQPKNK